MTAALKKAQSITTWRNIVAFWIFGLCNNYGYVIMLSAAEDIINKQQHSDDNSDKNSTCLADLGTRACDGRASTGGVLLADILPSLFVKATMPFLMGRVPYGFRHLIVVGLQTASYLVVAYSKTYAMSLFGVVLASLGAGIGETTYLSLSSHFPATTISSWSSGTGGAGVVGSFAYAALTEPHLGNLSAKNALLVMLVVPAVFAAAYWLLLVFPDTVYTPGFAPRSWLIPDGYEGKHDAEKAKSGHERTPQRVTSFAEKITLIKPLLKLMVPLSVVYFAEYLINQGLTQLIYFNCSEGFHLSKSSQYRWYQVLYQIGVFISRSSVNVVQLPLLALFLLPALQLANAVFFFFEARYAFLPHIAIAFALILVEGLYGGASYVNTFNWIHRNIDADVKEFSLSVASMSDAFGIVLSAFTAIGLHNYICDQLG